MTSIPSNPENISDENLRKLTEHLKRYECSCGKKDCDFYKNLEQMILSKHLFQMPSHTFAPVFKPEIKIYNNTSSFKNTALKMIIGASIAILGLKYGNSISSMVISKLSSKIFGKFGEIFSILKLPKFNLPSFSMNGLKTLSEEPIENLPTKNPNKMSVWDRTSPKRFQYPSFLKRRLRPKCILHPDSICLRARTSLR